MKKNIFRAFSFLIVIFNDFFRLLPSVFFCAARDPDPSHNECLVRALPSNHEYAATRSDHPCEKPV